MSECASVAHDLSDAIAQGRLELYVQPQIDVSTRAVVAVEGLCRWTHAVLGPIPASRFIALAEATGSIHELGVFSLSECCRYGEVLRERGEPLAVAVNVSPLQLATDDFFDELERELATTGLPAASLIIEVTEAERIEDYESVAARLDAIQALGVTVSIDDFGTGHSSIGRATALHARELKLDRSLVASGDWDAVAEAVNVAHDNGMRVVAEGVETSEQLDRIAASGCDRAQGYLIARPAPTRTFDDWMTSYLQ
jgi:EAL domain-containing protein (putative c-di-GMP-specific phosphodiesterase class I)